MFVHLTIGFIASGCFITDGRKRNKSNGYDLPSVCNWISVLSFLWWWEKYWILWHWPMFFVYPEIRGMMTPPAENNASKTWNIGHVLTIESFLKAACLLSSNEKNDEFHTIFLRDGWRRRLCRCEQCSVRVNELFFNWKIIELHVSRNSMTNWN